MGELQSNTVLITGGARGIGRAIALHCAQAGASVVVASRSEQEIAETVTLGNGSAGVVAGRCCDVSQRGQVNDLLQFVRERYGRLDALVCCAAITGGVGKFWEIPVESWEEAFRVNVFGVLHAVQAAVPLLIENGGGKIVILGGAGQGPLPRRAPYAATKGALSRMCETFAAELFEENIYVNSVLPGPVNTRFLDDVIAAGPERAGVDEYERALRQQREGGTAPELAADLVLYLLSPASDGLYGKTLSARWDNYREFGDLSLLSQSDLYTMRRVISKSGGTRS